MKSAIGIMGGTFNPFHNGHLQLALQAYRQFELSKVLVMPSGTPAHKSTKELIAASHRCQMVSGAIADYPYLELSLLEVERNGKGSAQTKSGPENLFYYRCGFPL